HARKGRGAQDCFRAAVTTADVRDLRACGYDTDVPVVSRPRQARNRADRDELRWSMAPVLRRLLTILAAEARLRSAKPLWVLSLRSSHSRLGRAIAELWSRASVVRGPGPSLPFPRPMDSRMSGGAALATCGSRATRRSCAGTGSTGI